MAKKDFKKNAAELFITTPDATPEAAGQAQEQPAGFEVPKGYRLAKEIKSARMQLLVRPNTKETLRRAAAAQGLSLNELVNQILDEYAERYGDA